MRHNKQTLLAILLLASLTPIASATLSDTPNTPGIGADGEVTVTYIKDNILYFGGVFSQVGRATAGLIPVDTTLGSVPTLAFQAGGEASRIISDGANGWYVGGLAPLYIDGVERNLIHINSSGALDSAFNVTVNGSVNAMVLVGSTLYFGGSFSTVGGVPRANAAAVDVTTGGVSDWDPDPQGAVSAIAYSSTTTFIYLGGNFATIGSASRNNAAAVDSGDGLIVQAWDPNADNPVKDLEVYGSTVYARGDFSNIGGQARSGLASLNHTSGLAYSWDPAAAGSVLSMHLNGSTLFVGGSFINIGGSARTTLASFDALTGVLSSFNPTVASAGSLEVNAMQLSGTTLFIGGRFTSVEGSSRTNAAAIDINTKQLTSWNPKPSRVDTMALGGTTMMLGGFFHLIGVQDRTKFAAMDLTTGQITSLVADITSAIGMPAAFEVSGSKLYIGGLFTAVNGSARTNLAVVDKDTGVVDTWNPAPDNYVTGIHVDSGTIFIGGQFQNIGATPRTRLASFNQGTGALDAWNPNVDGYIQEFVVNGSSVYIHGGFGNAGGQVRNRLASIDRTSGLANAWNPNETGFGGSDILQVGTTIYLAGTFTAVGGQARAGLAAVDANSGVVSAWNPAGLGSTASNLATDGGYIYVGGGFSSLGGATRDRLGQVSAQTGAVTSWNPAPDANISALAFSSNTLVVGGLFSLMNKISFPDMGVFNVAGAAVTITSPANGATVSGIVTVTATVGDTNQISTVSFYVDGVLQAAKASTSPTFSWDTTALTHRSYTIQVVGTGPVMTSSSTVLTVVVGGTSGSVEEVKAYPMPFRPSQGHTEMVFTNLPQGASVKIYTFLGELVKDFTIDSSGTYRWDVKNDSGEKVASGVYLVFIDGTGGQKKIRVAVQR